MSAELEKNRTSLLQQLSNFENRLDSKNDDVRILADIQDTIAHVLGEGGANEAQVRRILQDRYESGDLRKETFQLVKSMLDRFATEQIAIGSDTSHSVAANSGNFLRPADSARDEGGEDHPLSSTAVLPTMTASAADSADERVQVGSVLRDRFVLQQRVRGGGMGAVYKAMDRRLAEVGDESPWVAIKVLSSHLAENGHALRALQQEAAKGRCLTHPNIVRFMDLDRDDDLYFMVMEWLDGATLADILDSRGAGNIDQARAFEIVRQIGGALDYAHRCGIVHADVKPGNIMILPNGDAKLFDFGVARVRQKQLAAKPDFDPGILGLMTPAYSSMQVLTGEEPTPADDVFSLACLLYRLIAGYRVFGPRNAAEAAAEGMKPQRLEGLSDAQWRVLKKALSYARVTRYASMAEFMSALNASVNEPITITVPVRHELDNDSNSSGAFRNVLGLFVLLCLLVGAAWRFDYLDDIATRLGVDLPGIVTLPAIGDTAVQAVAPVLGTTDPVRDEGITATEEIGQDGAGAERTDFATEAPTVDVDITENLVPGETDLEPVDDTEELTEIPLDDVMSKAQEPADAAEAAQADAVLVDFSKLPPATAEVQIAQNGMPAASINVRLRENEAPVTIDLIRRAAAVPLRVRLEEVRHSGNRSPWASGQFELSDNGFVEFPAGQERARVTLSMAPDPVREADQQITLRVREADSSFSELAIITAVLEDDDQRAFEATLPSNTVAFATNQVSVREQDPAVQVDVLRFNPDNTSMVVGFTLRDITATQGEDYFAPGKYSIEFGPNQRSARILIPLVQDSAFEDNEAFSVELSTTGSAVDVDVYRRTAVMIRDDDM